MMDDLVSILPYLKDFGSTIMLLGAGIWLAKIWYPSWARSQMDERQSVRDAFKAQRELFIGELREERALNRSTQDRLLDMLEGKVKP